MRPAILNFDKVFIVTTIAMRLNRSHPFIRRNLFWFMQFLIILALSVTSFVFLTNSVLFYDIPAGRFTDASKNGTMAIVAITITMKYACLLYFQPFIYSIIETINKDYEVSINFDSEEREIISAYSREGAKVSMYWLIFATMTSSIFPLKAFYHMGYCYWKGEFQFVPLFDLRYPSRIDEVKYTPGLFWFLFLLCLLFGIYATTMYIGFDPLVPIFLLHICGQLDVLAKRMMKIFTRNSDSEEINENLKQVNIKLQELYE
jgi:hypothetical protein